MVGIDRRTLALGVAVALAAAVAVAPLDGLAPAGRYALATAAVAAVLWVTGAVPLALTALVVPVLLVGFGVYPSLAQPLAPFASPVIFLLLAGFALAEALQAHDLDRRVAYLVMARVGRTPGRLVFAIMLTTAGLSMLISNTATTAMMVPIALGIVRQVTGGPPAAPDGGGPPAAPDGGGPPVAVDAPPAADGGPTRRADPAGDRGSTNVEEDRVPTNMEVATILGTAYAATVGGVGTLIGTPPNAIVAAQLATLVGFEVTFLDWLLLGLPLVVVTLPLTWYLLVRVVYPPEPLDVSDAREAARAELRAAGPLDAPARRTVVIVAATTALWLLGGLEELFVGWLPPVVFTTLFGGPGESLFGTVGHDGVLSFVVVGLLAIPALVVSGAASFDDLLDIDWATLVLLGGGLSLATALADSGAIGWLADRLFAGLAGVPLLLVVLVVVAATVTVGELASNTAMAAVLAPLLVGVGPVYAGAIGTTDTLASVFLAVGVGVAASYGFALPVATPPNAIAYGTGLVDRRQLLRAGVPLDVVMILVVTASLYVAFLFVWPVLLG